MTNVIAIVLNYRRAELTTACVASLEDQAESIYVVDNSADGDENLKLTALLATRPHVKVLNPKANLGFGGGVQFALANLDRNQSVPTLVVNNDATAHPDLVRQMVATLQMHSGRALVTARSAESTTPSQLFYHRLLGLVLQRRFPGTFAFLSGACLMIPEGLTHPFIFDPDFFMYGEDIDLSWRTMRAGIVLAVADGKYDHAGSASTQTGSLFYEYHVVRGHIILARKLAKSEIDHFMLILGRAFSLPLRATLRSIRYRSLTPWRALILACAGCPPSSPEA